MAVLLGYAIYVAVWSSLTIVRFQSHHALVYDLGLALEQMWLPVHAHSSVATSVYVFLNEGLPYVLSPVGLIGGYPAILILQTLAVGGLALPIYGIATRLLRDRSVAMVLALSSLVFFASGGANWYDFHFESFFPLVFLTAYFLLLTGHRKSSFVAFVAICFVRFPFGVFPFLYGALLVFEAVVLRQEVDGMPRVLARKYGLLLAGTCGALLLVTLFVALPVVLGTGQFTALLQFSQTTSSSGPTTGAYDRLLTLVLPLATMLFLPLFSRRWIVFLAPYSFLLLATGFWAYSYPYAFSYQYVFSLVPFLYLGLIDVLARREAQEHQKRRASTVRKLHRLRARLDLRRLALVILATTLLTALFLEPYGPFNGVTEFPYGTSANLTTNETLLTEYHQLSRLIPSSDSHVLIQDNMPELFPRPLAGNEPLVPGVSLFANFTHSDAVNDSFPVWQYGKIVHVRFDYVIADQGSPQFFYGTPNMQDFVTAMYGSGAFGVLGEAGGMIVLERNYTGPAQYFVPYSAYYPVSSLFRWPDYAPISAPVLTATNTGANVPLWNGPFAPLMPGSYAVTFTLRSSDTSDNNSALVQVLSGPRAALLQEQTLTGSEFPANGTWMRYSMDFYAPGPEGNVQFLLRSLTWKGSLSLADISVHQLAAPTPTFRLGITLRDTAFYDLLATIPKGSTTLMQPEYAQGVLNLTVQTAVNSTVAPRFILVNPFASDYTCAGACGGALSIEDLVNQGLENATYGIVGEVDGILLLERGYTGVAQWYSPFQERVYPGDLVTPYPYDLPLANATLVFSNVGGSFPALWNGPFAVLPPGVFTVSFNVQASSNATTNLGAMQILTGPYGEVILNQTNFTGSAIPRPGVWTNLTADFTAPISYNSVQYLVRVTNWSGSFLLSSILLTQTGLP